MNDYDEQTKQFLENTKTEVGTTYISHDRHFNNDEHPRARYKVTITHNKKEMTFTFGQSYSDSYNNDKQPIIEHPTPYEILTSLGYTCDGSFNDFCLDFGYDTDSRKALDNYLAEQKQWYDLLSLGYSDKEMEQLQDIQ